MRMRRTTYEVFKSIASFNVEAQWSLLAKFNHFNKDFLRSAGQRCSLKGLREVKGILTLASGLHLCPRSETSGPR